VPDATTADVRRAQRVLGVAVEQRDRQVRSAGAMHRASNASRVARVANGTRNCTSPRAS
jgi:hypothetical protein